MSWASAEGDGRGCTGWYVVGLVLKTGNRWEYALLTSQAEAPGKVPLKQHARNSCYTVRCFGHWKATVRVLTPDPCPLQRLLPQSLLLIFVHAVWGTDVLLVHGEVTTFLWVCTVSREVNGISTSFGRSPHGGVHKAEERPQGLDDES